MIVRVNLLVGPLQNDSLTVVNNNTFVSGGVFGGGWQSMARDNTDPSETDITANFLGINWSLTSSAVNSGAWTLNIADPSPANLPVKVDLLAVLKGGAEGWVGYLFTSEIFTVTGPYAGIFDIQFANGGSQQPTLSHLSVYLRGRECTVNDNCGGGGGPGNSIPEPAQLALIGIGFLVMALARRNSRQA